MTDGGSWCDELTTLLARAERSALRLDAGELAHVTAEIEALGTTIPAADRADLGRAQAELQRFASTCQFALLTLQQCLESAVAQTDAAAAPRYARQGTVTSPRTPALVVTRYG